MSKLYLAALGSTFGGIVEVKMSASLFQDIAQIGQSIWYDNISRELLDDGRIAKMIGAGEVRGITSNPSIFEKSIASGAVYDSAVAEICARHPDLDDEAVFEQLAIADIQAGADLLRPVYDASEGADGYISLEVSPRLAHDAESTLQAAQRLHAAVDRPNLMIKVPATEAGFPVVTALIDQGISVNVTLLFSQHDWQRSAEAYVAGLRLRQQRGAPLDKVASVASFFVSRLDSAVDAKLEEGSPLRGTIAVAYAKQVYRVYREFYAGSEFAPLKALAARPQRLLWASTGTKNPSYSDLLYVENLFAADTVNTMPPATLDALRDHGQAASLVDRQLDHADQQVSTLGALGIDLAEITSALKEAGVQSFMKSYDGLLAALASKRASLPKTQNQ